MGTEENQVLSEGFSLNYNTFENQYIVSLIPRPVLLTVSTLDKYDTQGMYKIYDRWPELARSYFEMNYEPIDFRNIDHIVFTGMGGSGAIGNALAAILSKKDIHVCIVKGFHLPKTADPNTLVVATSASGNTIETLTVLETATKNRCKTIAFSSGGKMESYCIKNKIEHRKVPVLNSPRASFPIYLYSILNVLKEILPIGKGDVKESITQLEKTQSQIYSQNLNKNSSLEIAEWISGMPAIYYPFGLQAAAIRFKNSLAENAKMHSMVEDVIEACHNSIVAWESNSNLQPVLIQGIDDYTKTKELWKIIEEYFVKNKINYYVVNSTRGNILSKIVNLIYLLDYATIYKAILLKKDPTPIHSIDFIKNKMPDHKLKDL